MQQQQKDLRVINKGTLIALCKHGRGYGFNRCIDWTWIEANCDDRTMHVVEMLLIDHQAYDRSLPVHHRVRVWMRDRWSYEPRMFTLDISDADWRFLMTLDEFENGLDPVAV